MLSLCGGRLPYLSNVSSQENNQINYYNETKKMALNSQTVRAQTTLPQLSHGGPIQRQTSGTDLPMKVSCQGRHCI